MKRTTVFFSAICVLFVLCAVGGCKCAGNYENIDNSVPTISVQGQGKVETMPDEAIVSFGVTSEEKLLQKANKTNT